MLERLEKVNLRKIWNHEASAGSFNVNILAKNINSDSKSII